jgi:hypothetical protein
MLKYLKTLGFFCILINSLVAQEIPFGFRFDNSIPFTGKDNLTSYSNAWFGGMNAPQLQQTDLNNDGNLDLIVLDRSGNKVSVYESFDNRQSWTYNPALTIGLPEISNWFVIRDYNNDNLDDLFVSASNGISVYKRLPNSGPTPSFELVTNLLLSDYYGNPLNLFVSRVDIPAIDDIDGDGDLDILTFYILGTCVEYHKNLSQEMNGNSEELIFRLESDNWGNFTEDALSNSINYNDSCGRMADGSRHSGSALLIDDVDQDTDSDLLLGDVSFPEALFLINQPQGSTDIIVPTPNNYPINWSDVGVSIFPGIFRAQTNNDNLPDLVIAPNTEDQAINEGRLMKRYNSLSGSSFHFSDNEEPFLCHEMADLGRNSLPLLVDADNDGDLDLIVGTGGEFELPISPSATGNYRAALWLFENTGSANSPNFVYRTDDLGGFRALNLKYLAPGASDFNGDNLPEIIVGQLDGKFKILNNISSAGDFDFQLMPENSIQSDAFDFSAPTFFDANNDGLTDLISGSRQGFVRVFLNVGSINNPQFPASPDIEQWGNVETIQEGVSNYGYSNPAIVEYLGSNYLLCGTERGTISTWEITDNNSFPLLDSTISNIDEGKLTGITTGYLNDDQYPDLITGNARGGLSMYFGGEPLSIKEHNGAQRLMIFPNPATNEIYIAFNETNNDDKTIQVLDIRGKLMMTVKTNEKAGATIHLSGFSNGIYLIQVMDSKKSSFSKLIISR